MNILHNYHVLRIPLFFNKYASAVSQKDMYRRRRTCRALLFLFLFVLFAYFFLGLNLLLIKLKLLELETKSKMPSTGTIIQAGTYPNGDFCGIADSLTYGYDDTKEYTNKCGVKMKVTKARVDTRKFYSLRMPANPLTLPMGKDIVCAWSTSGADMDGRWGAWEKVLQRNPQTPWTNDTFKNQMINATADETEPIQAILVDAAGVCVYYILYIHFIDAWDINTTLSYCTLA